MLALMTALVLGVLLLGTATLSGHAGFFVVAAGLAAGLVLFLTRPSGLLARRHGQGR